MSEIQTSPNFRQLLSGASSDKLRQTVVHKTIYFVYTMLYLVQIFACGLDKIAFAFWHSTMVYFSFILKIKSIHFVQQVHSTPNSALSKNQTFPIFKHLKNVQFKEIFRDSLDSFIQFFLIQKMVQASYECPKTELTNVLFSDKNGFQKSSFQTFNLHTYSFQCLL